MPDKDFFIRTDYHSSTNALIIDEVGEFSTVLVDSLLNHGCSVSYYGKESRESFSYLEDKKNFSKISDLEEVGKNHFDYYFYFPKNSNIKIDEIENLVKKDSAKLLICHDLNFSDYITEKNLLSKETVNGRVVIYDSLFGPRIKNSFLGEIFTQLTKRNEVFIQSLPGKRISPISVNLLVRELLRTIFSSDSKGKSFFLETPSVDVSSVVYLIQKCFPQTIFSYRPESDRKGEVMSKEGLHKVSCDENLDEEVEKTCEWFSRNEEILPDQEENIKQSSPTPSGNKPLESLYNIEVFRENEEVVTGKGITETIDETSGQTPGAQSEKEEVSFLFTKTESQFEQKTNLEKIIPEPLSETKKSLVLKKFFFVTGVFLVLLLSFFVIPLTIMFGFGSLGAKTIILSINEAKTGDYSSAFKKNKTADSLLNISLATNSVTSPFYSLIGLGKSLENLYLTLDVAQKFNRSLKYSYLTFESYANLAGFLIKGQTVEWSEEAPLLKANLSLAYQEASLAQSSLLKSKPGFKFLHREDVYLVLDRSLSELRENLLKLKDFTGILPELLGTGGRKTYAVILQNNLEIRPTGGFLDSYVVVSFENGKLIDFETFNSYQADSQLKGVVEPPEKIREYLGEKTWYLRDSNWETDFPSAAKKIEWFLDKEVQLSLDGVIALNLKDLEQILSVIEGQVILSDNTAVDKDNILLKALASQEASLKEGKKDFLESLTLSVFEKIKTLSKKEMIALGRMTFELLNQKEFLVYLNNPQHQAVVADLSWDGAVKSYHPIVEGLSIYSDYLYINETNVGINKVNLYTKRQISQNISFDKAGQVSEKLIMNYDNQSPSDDWPAGSYRNYLRIYLPLGTEIESVLISGNSGEKPIILEAEKREFFEEYNKSVLAFLLEVPARTQKKVEINYRLPERINTSKNVNSYLFFIQKQSGIYSTEYNLTFSYPEGFVPLRVIPKAEVGEGQLQILEKIDRDKIFQIDFAH